jgi:hypothetical protein
MYFAAGPEAVHPIPVITPRMTSHLINLFIAASLLGCHGRSIARTAKDDCRSAEEFRQGDKRIP